MIADELDDVLDTFASCFPEVSDWLAKQTVETAKQWRESLGRLDYHAAKDAIAAFHRGDLKFPASWSQWPAEIARQSRKQPKSTYRPQRYIGGEPVVSCLVCQDTGVVFCWHPKSMRAMSDKLRNTEGTAKFGQRGTMYTCSVRCPCEAGTANYPSISVVYNEQQWVKCDGLKDAASIERLEQFIADKIDVRNHPRFDTKLADWNR